MAYDGRYDSPQYLNAFLVDSGFTSHMSTSNGLEDQEISQNVRSENQVSQGMSDIKSTSGINTPALMSAPSSPHVGTGTRAPPPTPESISAPVADIEHLPSIDEDHEENGIRISVADQPAATHPISPTASQYHPDHANTKTFPNVLSSQSTDTDIQVHNLDDNQEIENYQKNATSTCQKVDEPRIIPNDSTSPSEHVADASIPCEPDQHTASAIPQEAAYGIQDRDSVRDGEIDHDQKSSYTSTEPFPEPQDESTAISDNSDDDDSSINIIVDAPKSSQPPESPRPVLIESTSENFMHKDDKMAEQAKSSTAVISVSPVSPVQKLIDQCKIDEEVTEKGAPSARSTDHARVRKVILSNLPAATDFTLVQALIHGGAIEQMTVSQPSDGTATASVTFTDADACQYYYDTHPNGLQFKYNGKKYVTSIAKGSDVDVISGVLQNYLECGASRVIKVVGADDDWSMKALRKVAEGVTESRKVEAIVDSYRNESRSIIFRFTKIADAVTFRGQLLRDPEWKDTDILFMVDPCEKATSVHW